MTGVHRLGSSLGWSAANAVGSLVVKVLLLAVLSRLLGPREFGQYGVGMAFALILAVVGQLGVPTSLITVRRVDADLTSLALAIGLMSSTALAIAAFSAVWLLAPNFAEMPSWSIVGFALLIPAQVAVNILEAVVRRELKFRFLAGSEFAAALLGNGLIAVLCAVMEFGAVALVAGQISYCLIKIGILVFRVRPRAIPRWNSVDAAALTSGSLAIMAAEAANMATVQIQRPLVGRWSGVDAAGLWTRVYQIVQMQLTVVVQPLDNLVLPSLARMETQQELRKEGIAAAIQIVGLTTLPCAAATSLLAPLLVPVLFGTQWAELVAPLQIGSLIVFFRGVERLLLSASRAMETMNTRAVIQIAQLAVIVLALCLAAPSGIVVASWAYLGALAVGFCFTLASIHSTCHLRMRLVITALAPGVLLASIPLAAALVVSSLTSAPPYGVVPISVAFLSLCGCGALMWRWRTRVLVPLVAIGLTRTIARVLGAPSISQRTVVGAMQD